MTRLSPEELDRLLGIAQAGYCKSHKRVKWSPKEALHLLEHVRYLDLLVQSLGAQPSRLQRLNELEAAVAAYVEWLSGQSPDVTAKRQHELWSRVRLASENLANTS